MLVPTKFLESTSPALVGVFFTTEPPGKLTKVPLKQTKYDALKVKKS